MQWVSTFASGAEGGAPVYFASRCTGELSIKVFPQATLGNPSPSGYDVRRIVTGVLPMVLRRPGLLPRALRLSARGSSRGRSKERNLWMTIEPGFGTPRFKVETMD